ncbi:hypothetical protein BPORC_1849 [Bifidobacterium porcinum]|nr:hypothetical protein BPORC_1849 [Bifidobacterium porcinum]
MRSCCFSPDGLHTSPGTQATVTTTAHPPASNQLRKRNTTATPIHQRGPLTLRIPQITQRANTHGAPRFRTGTHPAHAGCRTPTDIPNASRCRLYARSEFRAARARPQSAIRLSGICRFTSAR